VDPSTPVKEGAGVCVKSKVAFLWTRHPLQVVYVSERPRGQRAPMGEHPPVPGGASAKARYTFAHGCLHGHMLVSAYTEKISPLTLVLTVCVAICVLHCDCPSQTVSFICLPVSKRDRRG
jgi:hypothetical protein